jgi:MFS family permease
MTVPLVLLTIVLLAASIILSIRKGKLHGSELLWGFLAAFLTVLLPIILGIGITTLISTASGNSSPWFAYPIFTRAALWFGALFCVAVVGAVFTRRAGLWGLAFGVWSLWTILALILTFTLTGVSVIFLCPSLFAAVLLALVSLTTLHKIAWPVQIALILSAMFVGAIWMNLALNFEIALGFETNPAVTLAVGLVASTMLPLLSQDTGQTRLRRLTIIGSAALVLIFSVAAILVPHYSANYPQRLNLYHYENRDEGAAFWITEQTGEGIPSAMEKAAEFESKQILPWSDTLYLVTPAPSNPDPAPELEVISDQVIGTERVINVVLRSPREAQLFDMLVPIERLASISIAGKDYLVKAEDSKNGFYNFYCFGSECSGLELTLHLVGATPVRALLIDYTYGLGEFKSELLNARNSSYAIPYNDGDEAILCRSVDL